MSAQPVCEACGQPIIVPAELPPLTPIQHWIFDLVRLRPGLTAERLVWADPSGGPESRNAIFVHIAGLNHGLAPLHIVVRSEAGIYCVRSAP